MALDLNGMSNGSKVFDKDDEIAARMTIMEVQSICAIPFALKAVITLGVPQILVNAGPGKSLTVKEIAKLIPVPVNSAPADAENLERILRFVAVYRLIRESAAEKDGVVQRLYGATAATKYLLVNDKSEAKQESFVDLIMAGLGDNYLMAFGSVHSSVLDKSKEAYALVHGKSLWEDVGTDPAASDTFNRAMTSQTTMVSRLVLEKYDGYKSVTTLVDVGGGLGINVSSVVAKYPHIRGINFDLPHVIGNAPQAPGVEHVGGSFFESVPECDAAFMKWILHDWDDAACVKILKNIEKALPEHGKLINVDAVLPETLEVTQTSKINFAYDWYMLTTFLGGKERTLSQFRQLGAAAGFSRVEIAVTVDSLSVLEFYKK